MPQIRFEPTPNPNALKCAIEPGSADARLGIRSYFNADAARAADDPLAHALFEIPGIANLLIHTEFITVGKAPAAKWAAIKPRVKAVIDAAVHDAVRSDETPGDPTTKGAPDA